MKNLLTSLFALGTALAAAPLSGAVLADYSFPTTNQATGFVSQDSDTQTTASSLFVNNLGTFGGAANSHGLSSFKDYNGTAPQLFIRADTTPGTAAAAISGGNYFGFTLTPETGLQVTYTSLTFNYMFDASSSVSTVFLRSSADDFASNIWSQDFASIATSNTANMTPILPYAPQNISLASLGTIDEAVTFRLYLVDNSGHAAAAHRIDDIILNGNVSVIPEPSSTLLLLGGLGTLIFLRRRRQN